jgi:GT2 family glycosyltransferase
VTDVVVVLNYHGAADTLSCVSSLVSGSPEARVLVVDNGSCDGALDDVRSRWPGVDTLQVADNLGFAGGMNVGLRWALDGLRDPTSGGPADWRSTTDTVTVLNNDTVVPPGTIARLAETARRGAAVSPEVRYLAEPDRVWFGGGTVDPHTNLARHLTDEELTAVDRASGDDPLRLTDVLAGCCVTATVATWRRVGLFDERYFLTFEDSDWSVRAGEAGVPLVVDRDAVLGHRVSASFTREYSYLGLYYYARNGLLFGQARCGGSFTEAGRFLRHHVLPTVSTPLRRGEHREGLRAALVVAHAVFDHARRRYGRVPHRLERRARRWSSADLSS